MIVAHSGFVMKDGSKNEKPVAAAGAKVRLRNEIW